MPMRALLAALTLLSAASPEFDRLKPLVGAWEAKTPQGAIIRVSFKLVANDSVLVQTFTTASGKETLTVFHPDGTRVLATHYCAQGNQPRLRMDASSTRDRFVFVFADATNLPARSASHLVKLELHLVAPDAYDEIETYEEAGKPDVTTLHFRRAGR